MSIIKSIGISLGKPSFHLVAQNTQVEAIPNSFTRSKLFRTPY